MNKKYIEELLDERFQLAVLSDLGNTERNFRPDNPDWIYYKGMIEMLRAFGYDWQKDADGGHHIFTKEGE